VFDGEALIGSGMKMCGDLAAALGRIKARTYVVLFSRDMFFS
jgi:hypothetical protein